MAWVAEDEQLAGEKTAKAMARMLAKVTKDVMKLHEQAVTQALMSLREGDLAKWVKIPTSGPYRCLFVYICFP